MIARPSCDPRLCSHIEDTAKCTMSASSSRPCAHRMPLLDNCSECGLEPDPWHIHAARGGKGSPAFPPRTQHVWCTGPGEAGLRAPLTNAQLDARYRASLGALEKAAPHKCLCEIETTRGSGHHMFDGRKLPSGLPVAVRNLRLLDGSARGRATLRLAGPLRSCALEFPHALTPSPRLAASSCTAAPTGLPPAAAAAGSCSPSHHACSGAILRLHTAIGHVALCSSATPN